MPTTKHQEPDADERGGRSDMDADDTTPAPRHHANCDMPMMPVSPAHGTCEEPTKPKGGKRTY